MCKDSKMLRKKTTRGYGPGEPRQKKPVSVIPYNENVLYEMVANAPEGPRKQVVDDDAQVSALVESAFTDVYDLLDHIGPREQRILYVLYGLDNDEEGTLKMLAEALALSRTRV